MLRAGWKARGGAVLLLVWAASAVYVAGFVRRGWIPHDEGAIALAAERVLQGDLVHRDFEGAYTGGLSHLHAFAFKLLGTRLVSLRLVLFAFFLAFVPVFYLAVRRFWRPAPAAAVTVLAVAWSVPNYFASMASWYNLFFALFGTLAALRYVDTNRRRYLFVAGLCGGLSVLAKITGLYFVAALLLFLVHAVQVAPESAPVFPAQRPRAFALFLGACCAALVVLLFVLIRHRSGSMELLHFVVPGAALGAYLLWYEAKAETTGSAARFRSLFALLGPAAAGFVLPIAVFLVPYALSGSLGSVAEGLAVSTQRQLENTRSMMYLPPLKTFWAAVPYLALIAIPAAWPRRRGMLAAAVLAVALALILIASDRTGVYRQVWFSARSLSVVAVLAGCRLLFDPGKVDVPPRRRLELFLLLCVTAMLSLVQFPFASPIYFCYTAPAVILTLAALIAADQHAPRALHGVVLIFYLGFALWRMNPGYVFSLGDHPGVYRSAHLFSLERAGLLVPEGEGLVYERLVEAIWTVDPGKTLFAGPDCPEIYFLAARRSPLTVFIDFQGPLYERQDALLRFLEAQRVRAVVINRAPSFSRRLRPEFLSELERRFPHSREIGHFVLRWADETSSP